MNRQQRRWAARKQPRHLVDDHHDCGCTTRTLVPVDEPTCPSCGQSPAMFGSGPIHMPTQSPLGTLNRLMVGCSCGHEFEIAARVS